MRISKELQIGKAGEYLTVADLLLKGFTAYLTDQGLPYDVLIDTGNKMLKCQVKTTKGYRVIPNRKKDTNVFIFNIKRHGKEKKSIYDKTEVDVFALVNLKNKSVIYLKNKEMPSTINIRADELKGSYYDEKGIEDFKVVRKCLSEGLNQVQTAKKLNLAIATVNRIAQKDFKPFKSGAKYWSDFLRDENWFLNI